MNATIHGLCPLLQVFDMPQALKFYRDVLGFRVISRDVDQDDCDWALLRWGPAEVMLNTAYESRERPVQPDPRRNAAHGDTTLYLNTPDMDAIFAELKSKGIDLAPAVVREYGMKQLMLSDPDGYGICFQCAVE